MERKREEQEGQREFGKRKDRKDREHGGEGGKIRKVTLNGHRN